MSYHWDRLDYNADVNRERRPRPPKIHSKHLNSKQLGFCPWCGWQLTKGIFCSNLSCSDYDSLLSEHENRLRYVRQRELAKENGEPGRKS